MFAKNRVVMSFIVLSVAALACKKDHDDSPAPPPSPQQLILGKWNYVSIKTHEHSDGGQDYTGYDIVADGDYLDFRTDGRYIEKSEGLIDSSLSNTYKVLSSTSMVMGSDTFTITTLTEKQLSLYIKGLGGGNSYYEDWHELKK